MKLPYMDALGSVGMVGERKAVALLCLGFFTTIFFMIGLSARTELPEWVPVFTAMTIMYGLAFFAVAAEWFWGRWFAIGLGQWGVTMAIFGWVQTRQLPTALIIFGVMHALIALGLMGEKMAAVFDAKPDWRARWKLDDQGVIRVRKSVTRAASSLPALIMFALAPKGDGSEMLGLAALTLVATGLAGMLLGRSAGVLALASGALATVALALFGSGGGVGLAQIARESAFAQMQGLGALDMSGMATWMGPLAAALLLAAVLPFARPLVAYVRRR